MFTTTDVYSAASLIGQELKLLVDEHGPADFESLMLKVINVLEDLELCVTHTTEREQTIKELREQHEALKNENTERKDFSFELDQMQQSWYNETKKLMDRISVIEDENRHLERQLKFDELSSGNNEHVELRVSEIVSGKHPFKIPARPSNLDVVLAETEERLLLSQQQSSTTDDLDLIRSLKMGVINQARELKELRKEVLFIEAYLDAAEEEVCRLARQSGQILAKTSTPTRISQLTSEQAELETHLLACERDLEELSLTMKNTTGQVESPQGVPMPLHIAPGQGLESAETVRENVTNDSLLALEQLRILLCRRNNLRCRLIELKTSLETHVDVERSEETVYGPLPQEPWDKLWLDRACRKSLIKSFFADLLSRISKTTSP